jgi:hypothetical protein
MSTQSCIIIQFNSLGMWVLKLSIVYNKNTKHNKLQIKHMPQTSEDGSLKRGKKKKWGEMPT